MAEVKYVASFEFDCDEQLSEEAVYILEHLKRKHCVFIQFDDGEAGEAVRELNALGQKYDYWTTVIENHTALLVEPEYFEVEV
jgi:hypothetical protein